MGLLVGLGVGVGLLLVLSACTRSAPLSPPTRAPSRLQRLVTDSGVEGLTVAGLVALVGSCALVAGLAVLIVSSTPPVAGVFAALAGYLPVAVLRTRAARRSRELAEVWPEAVDNLASAVRAGLSLGEALGQLGQRGPLSLRTPFQQFARDYEVSGRFEDCLDLLKTRLADPVGDRVVEALRLAREVGGGDLGRLLRSLSGFLREDARTRSELEARQSWTVNGARVAVASPWIVLLVMSTEHGVISRYDSLSGVVVLVAGAAVCLLAYRIMTRIGRLPAERRVLS